MCLAILREVPHANEGVAAHSMEGSYISGSNSFSGKQQYCCFQEPVTLGVTYLSQEETDSSLLFI